MASQRLTNQTDGTGVDGLLRATMGLATHRVAQPAAGAQGLDEATALGVRFGAVRVCNMAARPVVQRSRQLSVAPRSSPSGVWL